MKDFIKWLGVNEKVAKAVVWIMIILIMLIIINTALVSLGFPHYQINHDNLVKLSTNKVFKFLCDCLVCMLNFYVTVLLVFRTKESKKIFKFALLYMSLNWIITYTLGYAISQIFILLYIILFCYLYSGKKKKYILYGILVLGINTIIQWLDYLFKLKLIDFDTLTAETRAILSIDYFIIMAIIILVKEIYLKKRGEKKWMEEDHQAGYGSANSKKKTNSLKK